MKNIKNYFIFIFVLLISMSCKKECQVNSTNTKTNSKKLIAESNSVYKEVSALHKESDYNLENKVQKLDIKLNSLKFKIRYISDRAYLSIENFVSWQPVHINFYYDMSFEHAEKDIHVLLKNNDTSSGLLMFPAFTEQYATYFLYKFEKNNLIFFGTYEIPEFVKGSFSFDEKTNELSVDYKNKIVKLKKIQKDEELSFKNVQEDINILNEKNNITNIDKYSKDSAYFIKTFDINKDGILDKVISNNPYEGEDLLVYLSNKNSEYTLALKTINFSQDGGNQISDIKESKEGFEIITRFPDRGDSQTNYSISYNKNSFILKKIKTESYSWQDKYTNTCIQNLNFNMKNSIESLFKTIGSTKEDCTKQYDNK